MVNLKLIFFIVSGITTSAGIGLPTYSFYQEFSGDQFLLKEQYKEAKESYEKANTFYIPKYISNNYQNENLNNKIKKSSDLGESKSNYTKALEMLINGNKKEAKKLLERVIPDDKNYADSLNKINEINNYSTKINNDLDAPKPIIKNTVNSNTIIQNDTINLQEKLNKEILDYNTMLMKEQLKSQRECEERQNQIKKEYKKQIDPLKKQIKEIENSKNEICPNPFAEACMAGSTGREMDNLRNQLSTLNWQLSNLQQNELNETQATCGLPLYSTPKINPETYLKPRIPTYLNIEDQGSETFVIYGSENGKNVYYRMQPNGRGGYTIYSP